MRAMREIYQNLMGQVAGMSKKVYFSDVRLVTLDNPTKIDLVRAPSAGTLPDDLRAFIAEIGQVSRTVARVFADAMPQRRDLFVELHKTADLGLRGSDYSVHDALSNLTDIKAKIEDDFSVVRNQIWRSNLLHIVLTAVVAIPGGILYCAAQFGLWHVPAVKSGVYAPAVAIALAVLWIPLGVSLGVFLEYFVSVEGRLSYEQICDINPGRWRPSQRLINTVLTAFCFASAMGVGAVQFGILSISLNDFATTKPILSLVVGFVTGLSFPYVRDVVFKARPMQK